MNIGDEVKFSARGKTHVGVITDFKYKEHRKANRMAASFGAGSMGVPDTKMAVIKVDGIDNGYYTAPISMLKATGRNRTNDLGGARELINSIANKRARAQTDRMDRGRSKADEQGLYDLKAGDKVEVKYSSGWLECKFIKLSASGRALVENPHGREQWIATHLVRKPGTGSSED